MYLGVIENSILDFIVIKQKVKKKKKKQAVF